MKRATEATVKLPIFFCVWVIFLMVKVPTVAAGLVMVPVLWPWRNTLYEHLPAWSRPWSNPEDWAGGPQHHEASLPEWWVKKHGVSFWSFFKYHAIRNPANGLRSYEWADVDPDPQKIRFWTPRYLRYYEPYYVRQNVPSISSYGYIAWQGWRAGCKFVHHWSPTRHFVMKLGWRIEPRDTKEPLDPDGIRHEDAGFATKLLVYRQG